MSEEELAEMLIKVIQYTAKEIKGLSYELSYEDAESIMMDYINKDE